MNVVLIRDPRRAIVNIQLKFRVIDFVEEFFQLLRLKYHGKLCSLKKL